MNYIAKCRNLLPLLGIACVACSAPATDALVAASPMQYSVLYSITPQPASGNIDVTLTVSQPRRLLREMRFAQDPRLSAVRADGGTLANDNEYSWRPADSGGSLHWTVEVAHERNGNGYDAWMEDNWALLRAEDIIPRAATVALRGAQSKTVLQFDLPSGWNVVTPYAGDKHRFTVDKPERRFDQPDGWLVMGELGIRRDTIAGIRIAVAGPIGHSVRRLDILAMLNWNLNELAQILPQLPARLTIVSANDPMWRGGLSAPQSLYLHADRPLISENATSTLLHEVMHSALRLRTARGYDWIVEGLAEFYSLELLRRSGTISQRRHAAAMKTQLDWAKSATELCKPASNGATTALAVTVMADLDTELRNATDGKTSLDDVLPRLQQVEQRVDLRILRQIVRELTGEESAVLDIDKLPGCRSIGAGAQGKT